jgi:hypothetical protein
VLKVEEAAEIRRPHRAEGFSLSGCRWLIGQVQRPGGCVRGAHGHFFQAAPGWFGQHEGEREVEDSDPGGEQRAAQAEGG